MVSVIIPTYNRAYCIEKSIRSVLNQTYRDLELIIIDDGSTDNTREVVDNIKDERIRYIYQENAGACVARNHGIDVTCGEYIAFHDSDDIWYPDKLEKQIEYLLYTNADFVFSSYLRINGQDKLVIPPHIPDHNPLSVNDLLFENCIGTPTILIKTIVAKQTKFDIRMQRFQDWDFALHVLSQGYRVFFQNEVLMEANTSKNSITNSDDRIAATAIEYIFSKYHSAYLLDNETIYAAYLKLAYLFKSIDKEKTIKYLKNSIAMKFSLKDIVNLVLFRFGLW